MNTLNLILFLIVAAVAVFHMLPESFRAFALDQLDGFLWRYARMTGLVCLLTDEEFQKKVLDGVESQGEQISEIEKQNKELLGNYENLQKETKAAFEDLTKLKNNANDAAKTMGAIKRVQSEMKRERSDAFGDPLKRITNSEEKRTRINAELCRLSAKKGAIYRKDWMESAEVKALQSDGSLGTTFIDSALAREIYSLLESYGAWSSLGVRSVGTKTTQYPIATARPVAKFVRKLAGRKLTPDANKAAGKASIDVELIGCLVTAEIELLEDSEVDLSQNILTDLVEAVNFLMDNCAFVGDGTDDADIGGYTGIFEGGVASVATAGRTSIAALKYQDYLNAVLAVKAEVLKRNPRWWMHQQQLVRSIGVEDGNGRPIFKTALEAPSAGSIGTILGYPVTMVAAAPNVDAAGAKIAAFGDPQSYIVAVRKAIGLATSDDFAFDELSRAFRSDARGGFGFRDAQGISVLTLPAA